MSRPYSMISLGCARSLVDSETMINDLNQIGFQLVPDGTSEEVTILNTCSFIQAAIDETESNIKRLIDQKKKGDIKHIAVVGCYPSRFKKPELEAKFPDIDIWLSTSQEDQLKSELSQLVFGKKFQPTPTSSIYTKLTPSHYAYLKISEGCNNWCSFCTIPKIRGVHTSKPVDQLLKEAQQQINMGVKELILIAEDTTCWGEDIYGKPSLPLLLRELSTLDIDWIRVMYVFPPRVNDELITTLQSSPKLIPYLDMPIQHVNSDILKAMNRHHDRDLLDRVVSDLFDAIPNLSFRSTFILGFPGETDAHVDELIDFLHQHPFSQVGCFTFSKERETRSARLPDQVSIEVAKERVDRVMTAQYEILQKRNPSFIGQTFDCIYEGQRIGRTYREAPDVDNVIILDKDPGVSPGTIIPIKITGTDHYDFLATVTS